MQSSTRTSQSIFTFLAASLLIQVPAPAAQAVEYGGVQEDRTSFRLTRPSQTGLPPKLSQPIEAVPSIVSPDLSKTFAAGTSSTDKASQPLQQEAAHSDSDTNVPKVMWHPGVILTGTAGTQALNPTCDLSLAAEQAAQNPTSPEAAFIYAVALTKSSQVEQALKEVRTARNLARATGDANYFNRAVGQYEQSLDAEPGNECIRYGLAWAYYMQAYLFAEEARKQQTMQQMMAGQMPHKRNKLNGQLLGGASILASVLTGTRPAANALPHIPGALEDVPPWSVAQIKIYYEKCLSQLDEVIKRNPKDPWPAVYRAHVGEEYDGDHNKALARLAELKKQFPQNAAAAFFLADAYARNGNFAAGASSLSQALELHMQGK